MDHVDASKPGLIDFASIRIIDMESITKAESYLKLHSIAAEFLFEHELNGNG